MHEEKGKGGGGRGSRRPRGGGKEDERRVPFGLHGEKVKSNMAECWSSNLYPVTLSVRTELRSKLLTGIRMTSVIKKSAGVPDK